MSNYVVSEEVLFKIIKYLYLKATSNENDLTIDLSKVQFSAFDRRVEEVVPEVVDNSRSIPKVVYAAYVLKMEELGWIHRNEGSLIFTLTAEGFKQGAAQIRKESSCFYKRIDLKYYAMAIIAFVTLVYTVLAYYK